MDVTCLPFGIVFGENHFKVFSRKPYSGVLLRLVWLVGMMLLVMAYQGNLKVRILKKLCTVQAVIV